MSSLHHDTTSRYPRDAPSVSDLRTINTQKTTTELTERNDQTALLQGRYESGDIGVMAQAFPSPSQSMDSRTPRTSLENTMSTSPTPGALPFDLPLVSGSQPPEFRPGTTVEGCFSSHTSMQSAPWRIGSASGKETLCPCLTVHPSWIHTALRHLSYAPSIRHRALRMLAIASWWSSSCIM